MHTVPVYNLLNCAAERAEIGDEKRYLVKCIPVYNLLNYCAAGRAEIKDQKMTVVKCIPAYNLLNCDEQRFETRLLFLLTELRQNVEA